jgi:hypothetical protein
MRLFRCTTVIAALALSPVSPKSFDYSSQIGIVEFHSGSSACLTIQNASLKAQETVTIIVMDKPQSLETAQIEKKLDKSCSRDTNASAADSFYILHLAQTDSDPKPVSFAIARFAGDVHVNGGLARADLTATGSMHSFRSCTGTEGVHLTVWDGASSRKWHRYFYLGYDVEPDCTEKDYVEER